MLFVSQNKTAGKLLDSGRFWAELAWFFTSVCRKKQNRLGDGECFILSRCDLFFTSFKPLNLQKFDKNDDELIVGKGLENTKCFVLKKLNFG